MSYVITNCQNDHLQYLESVLSICVKFGELSSAMKFDTRAAAEKFAVRAFKGYNIEWEVVEVA